MQARPSKNRRGPEDRTPSLTALAVGKRLDLESHNVDAAKTGVRLTGLPSSALLFSVRSRGFRTIAARTRSIARGRAHSGFNGRREHQIQHSADLPRSASVSRR